ncbi:uncharacterized protein CCR75_005459 [Bremia lactucae]|uniref:RAVE complex protein Rav1 C-terminal domain-containing protein n=1 Tax=Bremia lactucae TaxID=4779 RepID=A0A976IK48_BRELC|nr:hypothetical protein CCR75_005459 [Bremia lactucae]
MGFRLEENIVAVCAPSASRQAELLLCQAFFESCRFLMYASKSLLVILAEMPPVPMSSASIQSNCNTKFVLWQVWDAQHAIQCVRFNSSKIAARGALALLIDKGGGVILMPASATSNRAAAVASRALDKGTRSHPSSGFLKDDFLYSYDYEKTHLHLHLPKWAESARWQCDDRHLNHLKWVESGDDLFLLGAGEKLYIWKVVDDSVQIYLQRAVVLSGGGGSDMDTSLPIFHVCHFDVTPSGRYVATAGIHDRIVKVWDLGALSPHESSPESIFLAHTRALVSLVWSKDINVYDARSNDATTMGAYDMLFALDRAGNVYIWRANVAPLRNFVLWKHFTVTDVCSYSFWDNDANFGIVFQEFGLVNHYWAHDSSILASSIHESMLNENTVMDALCLYHYGCGSLKEAYRNKLQSQRMNNVTNINAQLLQDQYNAAADSREGKAFICGNAALEKTFLVNLMYCVLSNGDFCIYRVETIHFTGNSPKLSLLLHYHSLREQLVNAIVYNVCSSDYIGMLLKFLWRKLMAYRLYCQDYNGSAGFILEVLYQQKNKKSQLFCAKLLLKAESCFGKTRNGSEPFCVQSCEVYPVCSSLMSATEKEHVEAASISSVNETPGCHFESQDDPAGLPVKVAVTNMANRLNVFMGSGSLRRQSVASQSNTDNVEGSLTQTAFFSKRGVIYMVIQGKMHVAMVISGGRLTGNAPNDVGNPESCKTVSLLSPKNNALTVALFYIDDNKEADSLGELIAVEIPDSIKTKWNKNPPSGLFQRTIKDCSLVIGLHRGESKLTLCLFSIEGKTSSIKPYRKTAVDVATSKILGIVSVPLLSIYQVIFATFDRDLQLTLWNVAYADELLIVKPAHHVNIGTLIKTASQMRTSHTAFNIEDKELKFKCFKFSSCGRVAILFKEGKTEAYNKICIFPAMECLLEGVVSISQKQFGQVVALEWTPPITYERDCELIFLTTTAIGMLKFDCALSTNKWSIIWSSSRLGLRPVNILSISSYPYGLVQVESSFAHFNLRDIDGNSLSESHPPFQSPIYYHERPLVDQPFTKSFTAHHPITLMYLLARGSFQTLETVLEHMKTKILDHEKMCFLQATDDTALRGLPLISLSQLLTSFYETLSDERSDIYLRGKQKKGSIGTISGAATSAPARACDLFATKHDLPRRYNISDRGLDIANTFNTSSYPTSINYPAKAAATLKSKLTTDEFRTFFFEHKRYLTFMTSQEQKAFLAIVAGTKRTVCWENDSSRPKDEAALRFQASLLWPSYLSASALPSMTIAKEPFRNRAKNIRAVASLCSEQIAWGALSDYQSEILQECLSDVIMSWNEFQHLRLPFWLKSYAKLFHFVEKVAQVEYAANRDPFAVAVFYVLLGKNNLLASLFKMANETRIAELLSNNFNDSRWINAALKNAFVLKTKQRYTLSAAFFLLGGQITEAVSVAEKADETLVLPFLIARMSERWDFEGNDNLMDERGEVSESQASFTGVSPSLKVYGSHLGTHDNSLDATKVCTDFLRTTVWAKASECGDVYMCFLIKYLLGERSDAIDILASPPAVEIQSMFSDANTDLSNLYWSAFGKSLLGACDLLRFLRKTIVPIKLALKEKIVRLNTIAMLRLQGAGLGVLALIHQRDTFNLFQDFCRSSASSLDVAAFLACRERIIHAALGSQVDFLYATFTKSMCEAMTTSTSSASDTELDFEDQLNQEIQCIVRCGEKYAIPGVLETSKKRLEHRIKHAVVESLVSSGRLAAVHFLISKWRNQFQGPARQFAFTSSLPQIVENIAEEIVTVASGDLMSGATDHAHTRKIDQACSNLLAMAERLLLWLKYIDLKPAKKQKSLPYRDFYRVAVAAVYSAICICCRYLKYPCCLYQILDLIYQYKGKLISISQEAFDDIARDDTCVNCASLCRSTPRGPDVLDVASLQQDVPILYRAICILIMELNSFSSAVKRSRLRHSMPSRNLVTPLYSFCSYWEMVLMMAAGEMPNHLLKLTGENIDSAGKLIKKLVETWKFYCHQLAGFATKHLLCNMAGDFFRSIQSPSSPEISSLVVSPRELASPSQIRITSSPRAFFVNGIGSSPSSRPKNRRHLLKCDCETCPWLLLVELFTDKHELLLRLNTLLKYCNDNIEEDIRWGRLPEPASRKVALPRSQKLVLSPVALNSPSFSRAAKFADRSKRRTMSIPTAAAVHVQCLYRSETTIRAMCFNRAAAKELEVSVCSGKGISRASFIDGADNCHLQFKGMYAPPKDLFFSSTLLQSSPVKEWQDPSAECSSNASPLRSLAARNIPSPLQNSAQLLASPSEASFKPTAMASHPYLPLFVSGNQKGRAHLWAYDRLSAVCAFQTKDVMAPYPTSPPMLSGWRSIKALKFDNLGQQLGAVDAMGQFFMWKFSELDRASYYKEMVCHDKGAEDIVFLNSSSSIATVGTSSEKKSLCVWDTLLPASKALIMAPACHPTGATAVAYSSIHQLLITGGSGGALNIFDLRQRRFLHSISNAHETSIKTIVMHPTGECVLSGSAGGDVKIWSLPIFREVAFLGKVHVKPSFLGGAATNFLGDAASNVAINMTNSSWGVTDAFAYKDSFLTCGTDGSVQRLLIPSLGTHL